MSLAADLNAPPTPAVPARSIIAIAGGLLFTLFVANTGGSFLLVMLVAILSMVAGIFLLAPTERERAQRDAANKLYSRQWYCRRCGDNFFEQSVEARGNIGRSAQSDYSFVSPVVSTSKAKPRQAYVERVLDPVQRAASMTARDAAGLDAIRAAARPDGSFDPEKMSCDLGVISRLSSLGLIRYDKVACAFLVDVCQSDEPRRGWWQRTFG